MGQGKGTLRSMQPPMLAYSCSHLSVQAPIATPANTPSEISEDYQPSSSRSSLGLSAPFLGDASPGVVHVSDVWDAQPYISSHEEDQFMYASDVLFPPTPAKGLKSASSGLHCFCLPTPRPVERVRAASGVWDAPARYLRLAGYSASFDAGMVSDMAQLGW